MNDDFNSNLEDAATGVMAVLFAIPISIPLAYVLYLILIWTFPFAHEQRAVAYGELQSVDEATKNAFNELVRMSDGELYVLRGEEKICPALRMSLCRDIGNDRMKDLVNGAIEYRKTHNTLDNAEQANSISRWALRVSVLALIATVLMPVVSGWRSKKA
jgi:hypothetical protein